MLKPEGLLLYVAGDLTRFNSHWNGLKIDLKLLCFLIFILIFYFYTRLPLYVLFMIKGDHFLFCTCTKTWHSWNGNVTFKYCLSTSSPLQSCNIMWRHQWRHFHSGLLIILTGEFDTNVFFLLQTDFFLIHLFYLLIDVGKNGSFASKGFWPPDLVEECITLMLKYCISALGGSNIS